MSKKYVILNFSDYIAPGSRSSRGTPIQTLTGAIERRVHTKKGTFYVHHLADLLAQVRLEWKGKTGLHDVEGLLDEGWIRSLFVQASVYRSEEWATMINQCRSADKIIFSAHGLIDDTDNVYCEVSSEAIHCGTDDGVVCFLDMILNAVERTDPTITLSVCYAARSLNFRKHHVSDLSEGDIESSLAFKIFCGLSKRRPRIRLTARTGAVAGEDTGSSLVTQTEEAIIAAEMEQQEFPGNEGDELIATAFDAYSHLNEAMRKSRLTDIQKQEIEDSLYRWYNDGYELDALDEILKSIDLLDEAQTSYLLQFLVAIGQAANPSWSQTHSEQVKVVKDLAPLRHRLYELRMLALQKLPKYGKFIYQRHNAEIVVSRWLDDSLVQVARF